MKAEGTAQLWQRLAAAGLASGEVPAVVESSPWYVRVMLGFAGWLGALFLLGFVGIALAAIIENGVSAAVTGALLCATAGFIFRGRPGEFAVQFGLAISFAGQALAGFGIVEMAGWSDADAWLLFALFETAVVLLVANGANRLGATVVALVSIEVAMISHGMSRWVPALATAGFALVWLKEIAWAHLGSLLRPVGYGLVLAVIGLDLADLFRLSYGLGPADVSEILMRLDYWAALFLKGATLVVVVWCLLPRKWGAMDGRAAVVLVLAALVAFGLYKAPGLVTALLALLLGFANGNRVLAGIGILAGILYMGDYYYQMEATLLEKSFVLVSTGLLLLLARFAFLRFWPAAGGEHA